MSTWEQLTIYIGESDHWQGKPAVSVVHHAPSSTPSRPM